MNGEKRNACRLLVRAPEVKTTRKSRRRWVDKIKMDLGLPFIPDNGGTMFFQNELLPDYVESPPTQ
jgi:hypothetical protein